MANLIPLRGPSDFYLACVLKFIHGQDRSKILGGLRSLVKMAQNEKNSKIILGIDVVLIQRLVQLLLIPDEDLVVNILVLLFSSNAILTLYIRNSCTCLPIYLLMLDFVWLPLCDLMYVCCTILLIQFIDFKCLVSFCSLAWSRI